jgi:hypothetical protein
MQICRTLSTLRRQNLKWLSGKRGSGQKHRTSYIHQPRLVCELGSSPLWTPEQWAVVLVVQGKVLCDGTTEASRVLLRHFLDWHLLTVMAYNTLFTVISLSLQAKTNMCGWLWHEDISYLLWQYCYFPLRVTVFSVAPKTQHPCDFSQTN